jgi:hypothetical protein
LVQHAKRFPDYVRINYCRLGLKPILHSVSRQQILITYDWSTVSPLNVHKNKQINKHSIRIAANSNRDFGIFLKQYISVGTGSPNENRSQMLDILNSLVLPLIIKNIWHLFYFPRVRTGVGSGLSQLGHALHWPNTLVNFISIFFSTY